MVQRHINFDIKQLSMKEAHPQDFNRVKFIVHSNTFAGSMTCMPTVYPKDHITPTPHRLHQTSDITQPECLPLSSDGILNVPDIVQLQLSDSFLKIISAMFNWA